MPPNNINRAPAAARDVQPTNNDVRFTDLAPEVRRTIVATRHLIIGVGGVGLNALTAIAYGMQERGMRFGEPDVARKVVVDGFLIDGDERTFDTRNDVARFLQDDMGLTGMHLMIPEQGAQFRQHRILDNSAAPLPAEADSTGCNANPSVGLGRYAIARKAPKKDATGKSTNPKRAIEDIIGKWKTPGNPIIERTIYINVIGGLAGGTGPIAAAVLADTVAAVKKALGQNHQVTTELTVMSDEPFRLDPTIDDGMQDRRAFNSVVQIMNLNRFTHKGGVQLPTREFIEGYPRTIYVLDGQSPVVRVSDGQPYEPLSMLAKVALAEITGEGTAGRSALSNIRETLEITDIPEPGTEKTLRPLSRFSALGACETITDPPPVILEREKKRTLFLQTVGLAAVTTPQVNRVYIAQETVLPLALVDQLKDEIDPPVINEDEIFVEGDEENSGVNAERAVRNFTATQLLDLRTLIQKTGQSLTTTAVQNLQQEAAKLLKEEGLNTEKAFLTTVAKGIAELKNLYDAAKTLAQNEYEARKKSIATMQQPVDIKAKDIPKFFKRKKAIANLREEVTNLVNHINKIAENARDFGMYQLLLGMFIPTIEKALDAAQQTNQERMNVATTVYNGIKERFDPTQTGITAVDLKMPVAQTWSEDPRHLRTVLPGFSESDLADFVESIELKLEDTDIMQQITPEIAEAVGSWAEPFTQKSTLIAAEKPRGLIRQFTVPKEFVDVDRDGRVIGTKNIPAPKGYHVIPVATAGRVMASTTEHGLSPLDNANFVTNFRRFLELPPSEREKYFMLKGDMEEMLPPFAEELAARELQRDNRGSIATCPSTNCSIDFYRRLGEQDTHCPGCRKIQAKPPLR